MLDGSGVDAAETEVDEEATEVVATVVEARADLELEPFEDAELFPDSAILKTVKQQIYATPFEEGVCVDAVNGMDVGGDETRTTNQDCLCDTFSTERFHWHFFQNFHAIPEKKKKKKVGCGGASRVCIFINAAEV